VYIEFDQCFQLGRGSQTSSSQVPVSYGAAPCCLPVQFAASNIFLYRAELEFEGELPCSTYTNQVLPNQGRKVANLSDRGNGLPCNSEMPSPALTLFDGNASWQKSGTPTEEAPLSKLLLGLPTEEAPQAKLLPPIRGMCARVQYNTLYKVTMFVEGRKWLPLGFPLRKTRACICLVVESLPQFKTNGIWARRDREPSDQVSADRTGHPDQWLEDAPASYHEVGLVRRDLMDVVRQPRILIILLIPISAAVSGIRSIRPLRLERQNEQRILQHLASGVLHKPLGCFRFHPGQLVLHLLDEAGILPVTEFEFESGDSTYVSSRQLKPMGSACRLCTGSTEPVRSSVINSQLTRILIESSSGTNCASSTDG